MIFLSMHGSFLVAICIAFNRAVEQILLRAYCCCLLVRANVQGGKDSEVMAKPLKSYEGQVSSIEAKGRRPAGSSYVGVKGWQWYTNSRVSNASKMSREGDDI